MKLKYWTVLVGAMALMPAGVCEAQGESIPASKPPATSPPASSTANSSSSAKVESPRAGDPKLRVTVSAVGATEVLSNNPNSTTSSTSAAGKLETVFREVTLVIECDQISLTVTSDDKGNPNYSFTSTGPVSIYGQQMSLRGEDATMENGKLIVKNAVVTSSIAKMQSSELTLDIVANGVAVNRWNGSSPLAGAGSANGVRDDYFPPANAIPQSNPRPSGGSTFPAAPGR